MTIPRLVSLTVSIVVLALACSKQGEGERCVLTNGNQDCDDNLTCMEPVAAAADICDPRLANQNNCMPYRCCYPAPQVPTDSRCIGYSTPLPVSTTGGSDAGVGGSSAAGAGVGGSSSAGTASTGGDTATGGSTGAGGTSATAGGVAATGGTTSPSST